MISLVLKLLMKEVEMSTIENLVSLRKSFERTAAVLLFMATAVTVAGGAVAMCTQPFLA